MGIMQHLGFLAAGFIGLFQEGGKSFVGMVTGMLPTLIALITAINAFIHIMGQKRINKLAQLTSRNIILRYTVFNIISMLFFGKSNGLYHGAFSSRKI